MAKYTMLFADYLERGGALPASFDLIDGFEDLFKKHYCDKEIGFETELLFAMKLEEYADIYMQLYADKLTRLTSAFNLFDAGAKVRYVQEGKTFTGGEQHGKTTELPFDSTDVEPSLLNDSEEYTNTDDTERTETETGGTLDELQRRLEYVNQRAHSIIVDLLNVFKPLFMGVY